MASHESARWLDMGWGRLIFGDRYGDEGEVGRELLAEADGARDIAFQLKDPHVVIAQAPNELFLDPSHTYRLTAENYQTSDEDPGVIDVRRARRGDGDALRAIFARRGMLGCADEFFAYPEGDPRVVLVATAAGDGRILGAVTGVDHVLAYGDPRGGSSLWCLCVDPDTSLPGVGERLVRGLCELMFERGRRFVDLSVLHDNEGAIRLYDKLGFARHPAFVCKRRNRINQPLFSNTDASGQLNPYASIIVDEAHRRGILVDVIDTEKGLFELRHGGVAIRCYESLTDLTSAIAYLLCDDKRATRDAFVRAGLRVPDQRNAGDPAADRAFLSRHGRVVVKPARGEQGRGVVIGIDDPADLEVAIRRASEDGDDVLIEEMVEGEDLRVIVIDERVVAAAVRKPPIVVGTGEHSVRDLISRYDRRRRAATGGESRVPIDEETLRCLDAAGHELDDVPDQGTELELRKTANLHTGGTIHDVTREIHDELVDASVRAARALRIPVVGLDLIVPDVRGPDYVLIEANERPGLANHEPQPTAQRFLDLLFPHTAHAAARWEAEQP